MPVAVDSPYLLLHTIEQASPAEHCLLYASRCDQRVHHSPSSEGYALGVLPAKRATNPMTIFATPTANYCRQ